jgi:hypothetical protein
LSGTLIAYILQRYIIAFAENSFLNGSKWVSRESL